MNEWMQEKETLDESEKILGSRVKMPTLRKYKALGLTQLRARRVPSPKRGNPTRTVAEYHVSLLDDLRFIAKGLSEGKTLGEITRERTQRLTQMNEDLLRRLYMLTLVQQGQTKNLDQVEKEMESQDLISQTDHWVKGLLEPEKLSLLKAANEQYDKEGRQGTVELHIRAEAWKRLGENATEVRTRLREWYAQSMMPLARQIPDEWAWAFRMASSAVETAQEELKGGNIAKGFYLLSVVQREILWPLDWCLRNKQVQPHSP